MVPEPERCHASPNQDKFRCVLRKGHIDAHATMAPHDSAIKYETNYWRNPETGEMEIFGVEQWEHQKMIKGKFVYVGVRRQ
jgi:hypothetical protein